MITKRIRLSVAVVIPILILSLSGCWNNHELHTMSIVTGIALDKAENPDNMDISIQIAKSQPKTSSGAKGNASDDDPTIIFKTTQSTLMQALTELSQNSSRTTLLQHNQVLLFGSSFAEQGVKEHLDLFIRNQRSRMETLVLIADGRAEEVLDAKLEQEKISGIFLAHMMAGLSHISPNYRVTMLDFDSWMVDESPLPVAPIIKLSESDADKSKIELAGLAVFREGRMIGRLNNDELLGYIWYKGEVSHSSVTAKNESGSVVFQIMKLDCKRNIKIRPDGGVKVNLSVGATLGIGELKGFKKIALDELTPELIDLSENEIKTRMIESFKSARKLNADIYGFGREVHRKYPKKWKTMKYEWDKIFPDIDFDVNVDVHLPITGQIMQSLETKEDLP